MSEVKKFDCIVIGLGSMGSAACYYLAKRGYKVLGLEQFDIVHDQGSHAGQSRIIRKAYFEHPDYVPLLERAYENWSEIERESSSEIYVRSGLIYLGLPDSDIMRGVKESARLYRVALEQLSLAETKKRFPQFSPTPDFEVLFEPDAGFVTPERAVLAYIETAIRKGAAIRTKEKMLQWEQKGNEIEVMTIAGKYRAAKMIVTAGAWTSKLIKLNTPLKVTRQTVAWLNPASHAPFTLGNFPCWFIEVPGSGSYYGFPILPVGKFGGPIGLKLAHHSPQFEMDPDNVNRALAPEHVEDLRSVVRKYFPLGDGEPLSVKTCLYTYSKDEHFIIDHLPGTSRNVTIACGFSGHGFKFASVIGEVLADMAITGKTALPAGFLGLARFGS